MEPIPTHIPTGYGEECVDFLASRGLVASSAPIRKSHYSTAISDPFGYYLRHRLRIASALSYSTALSRGSWFAMCCEHDWDPDPTRREERLPRLLAARLAELRDICRGVGIVGDSLAKVLLTEERDYHFALATHRCVSLVPVEESGRTLRDCLTAPHFELLGVEVPLSFTHPEYGPLEGRLDALLLHRPTSQLWIVDHKTTSYSPITRASLCPLEFETWHYLYMVRELLKGEWRRSMGLPSTVTLGGMIHAIVQKCSLLLSGQDRDWVLDETPFKSGPRKGEPRNEKVYSGEPRFENYLERVASWYTATNEYEHLLAERTTEGGPGQPCNLSFTSSRVLDDDLLSRYNNSLSLLHSLATRPPVPSLFPKNMNNALPHGKATPLSPFYLQPPRDWPDAMLRGRLFSPAPTERTQHDDLAQPELEPFQ